MSPQPGKQETPPAIIPMSGPEFQNYYDCGLMPERFWPEEIERLRQEYAEDKITLQELDDALDDMMRPISDRLRVSP